MELATNAINPQDGASELRHPTEYKLCKINCKHFKIPKINIYVDLIINMVILKLIPFNIYYYLYDF